MVIKRAELMTSLAQADEMAAGGAYEMAVAGKSNVGKSSLINALGHNQKLARTSSEPGKTRLINLFKFYAQDGREFVLVDLPGYGFARVSRDEKERWRGMIEGYLSNASGLKHVLMLVDSRHEPSADDALMVQYLRHYALDFTVVATKADKLSRAQVGRSVQAICRALQVQPWEVLPVSAQSRQGMDKLLERLDALMPMEAPEAVAATDAADMRSGGQAQDRA